MPVGVVELSGATEYRPVDQEERVNEYFFRVGCEKLRKKPYKLLKNNDNFFKICFITRDEIREKADSGLEIFSLGQIIDSENPTVRRVSQPARHDLARSGYDHDEPKVPQPCFNNCRTVCGSWLACASIAVAAWAMICRLAISELACA